MKNNELFNRYYTKLMSFPISIITPMEKTYITFILAFQDNNKELFASNQYIADSLGVTVAYIKKLNSSMNKKFDFFTSIVNYVHKNGKDYASSHTITINEDLLNKFLDGQKKVKTKEVKPSIKEESIPVEPVYQSEPEVSVIEEKEVETPTEEEYVTDNYSQYKWLPEFIKQYGIDHYNHFDGINLESVIDYYLVHINKKELIDEILPIFEGQKLTINQIISKIDELNLVITE